MTKSSSASHGFPDPMRCAGCCTTAAVHLSDVSASRTRQAVHIGQASHTRRLNAVEFARCLPGGTAATRCFAGENSVDAASWRTALQHASAIGMTGQSFLNMLEQGAANFQQIALLVKLPRCACTQSHVSCLLNIWSSYADCQHPLPLGPNS